MLAKFANLATSKSLTELSKTLVRSNNVNPVRCYSKKLNASVCSNQSNCLQKQVYHKTRCDLRKLNTSTYLNQFNCIPKTLIPKNTLILHSRPELAKIISNSLIQKREGSSHDHTNVWKLERILAAMFVPMFPLAIIFDNQVLDAVLAVIVVMHQHWGLEAFIIDYARPIVVGKIVPKLLYVTLYLVSVLTLAGLIVLAYNGPGISKVFKQFWAVGTEKSLYDDDDPIEPRPRNQIPREESAPGARARKPGSAMFAARMRRK